MKETAATWTDVLENEARKPAGVRVAHVAPECLCRRLNCIKRSTGSHRESYEDKASGCVEDGPHGKWVEEEGRRRKRDCKKSGHPSCFQEAPF